MLFELFTEVLKLNGSPHLWVKVQYKQVLV